LHRLLLGIVKGLAHWLLKYLKGRNVKDQFDNRFTLVPRYPGLQHFAKPFNTLKNGIRYGKVIQGMIKTLAVDCTPILDCSKDDGKAAVDNASEETVMVAVQALCQFFPLGSQQNHLDLYLKALDDALKRFCQKKGIFREQTMSNTAKPTVDDVVATESHQLCEQKIHKIRAAMEALGYVAENVSTTKCRISQVRLNRPLQAATTW
jgi:hypothetical protein